jgi:sulfatase maturation enzyme AslB (radical SAM superfamily)
VIVSYDVEPARSGLRIETLVDLDAPCNLACVGCRRRHAGRGACGREAAEAMTPVVKAVHECKPAKVHAVFFGGEPLLGMEALLESSRQIQYASDAEASDYRGAVITNGTLLDVGTASRLSRVGIEHAVVTLFGPEIHDARRPLPGGRGSFARIMSNLLEARHHLALVVRCEVASSADVPHGSDLLRALGRARLQEDPNAVPVLFAYPASYAEQARSILALLAPALPEDRQPGVPAP